MEPSEERARLRAEKRARKAAGDAEVDAFYRVDDDQYEAKVVDFGEQLRAAHHEQLLVEARNAAEAFDAAFRAADKARRARGDYSERPGPTAVEEFETKGLAWYTPELRRFYRQRRTQQRERPAIVRPTPSLGIVPAPKMRAPRERRDRPSSRSSPRSSRGSPSSDPDGEPPRPDLARRCRARRRARAPPRCPGTGDRRGGL